MKFKPLADNILIKPITEQKTPSGILIPDTAKEKPQEGEVIAVGPGKLEDGKRISPEVKEGDRVLYKKWGGTEIKLEGEDYLIVSSDDILGILE